MSARKRLRLLDGAGFDATSTRFCMPCKSGIACYRGCRNEHGEWEGTLAGIAANRVDADRFLTGAFVQLL